MFNVFIMCIWEAAPEAFPAARACGPSLDLEKRESPSLSTPLGSESLRAQSGFQRKGIAIAVDTSREREPAGPRDEGKRDGDRATSWEEHTEGNI